MKTINRYSKLFLVPCSLFLFSAMVLAGQASWNDIPGGKVVNGEYQIKCGEGSGWQKCGSSEEEFKPTVYISFFRSRYISEYKEYGYDLYHGYSAGTVVPLGDHDKVGPGSYRGHIARIGVRIKYEDIAKYGISSSECDDFLIPQGICYITKNNGNLHITNFVSPSLYSSLFSYPDRPLCAYPYSSFINGEFNFDGELNWKYCNNQYPLRFVRYSYHKGQTYSIKGLTFKVGDLLGGDERDWGNLQADGQSATYYIDIL